VRLLLSGHVAVAMENAALRVQLVAFQRKRKRPTLTSFDRLFWVGLSLLWAGWRPPLVYVRADTVVRWQRGRFRRFWARRSKVNQRHRGRPATAGAIRRLIERMVAANPLWHAPSIHGELTMLGIEISERTVSRILRRLPRPPGQTWKTFLRNHIGQMASIELLHRAHHHLEGSVRVHRIGTSWSGGAALQRDGPPHGSLDVSVEAFAEHGTPRDLVRDRDGVHGSDVRSRMASLPIEEILKAPRSPWQNPYAERLIGSIRRECQDHFIILNARHLKRTLASYFSYYHGSRTPLGLDSRARFPGRSPVPGGLFKSPNLEGYTTAMNVSQREGLGAGEIMANDRIPGSAQSWAGPRFF
jgi:putative transposase